MPDLEKIQWNGGVVRICFGESDIPLTQDYFRRRSGITNGRTLDKIQRKSGIKLKS